MGLLYKTAYAIYRMQCLVSQTVCAAI